MALTDIDAQRLGDSVGDKLGDRNFIINGGMTVAQRSTSATGLTNGSDPYQTVDRFRFIEQGSPTYVFTMTQSTDAPVGFGKSLKLECTTAQGALAAGDVLAIDQFIEAQDLQQLDYGTADAKTITLSFWVKSNKTGTFVAFFEGDDSSRSCTHSYTINAANTWEYKTITVAGDTVGVINDDNGRGLVVRWYLASGTTYTSGTASTTYQADVSANRAVGLNVNLADTVSNNWSITGVQLEIGNTATPFAHSKYSDELLRCSRYFVSANWQFCAKISGVAYRHKPPGPGVVQRTAADMSYFHPVTGVANQCREHSSGTARTIDDAGDALSTAAGATNYFGTDTTPAHDVHVKAHYDAEL